MEVYKISGHMIPDMSSYGAVNRKHQRPLTSDKPLSTLKPNAPNNKWLTLWLLHFCRWTQLYFIKNPTSI